MSQYNVFGGDDSEDDDRVSDQAVTGFDGGVLKRYVIAWARDAFLTLERQQRQQREAAAFGYPLASQH